MTASRTTVAFVVFVAALTLSGCGGDKPTASESETQPSGPPAAGTPIDACTLIIPGDISKLLGKPIEGKSIGGPDTPACTWENRETYESITVEIGNPGTAVNGTLPAPEPGFPEVGTPGPDGMRFLASGMVEFPAAGRSNTVQVAVLALMGQDADNAAVDLARKIGPQLPQ
jgi:hypothetical protein